MPEKIAKVLHDLVGGVKPVHFCREIEAQPSGVGRDADAADHGHFSAMPAVAIQNRSPPLGSSSATHQWIQKQAGFVEQDEVGFGFDSFF